MEPKISVEESVNHSLHLKKSVPDTQRAQMYTRHYREPIKKIIRKIYDENLSSDPLLSEPDIGMLSSPSQGQSVGRMEVPTTLDGDHEDHGKPTHQHGQDDIYKVIEGQKKDGVEENNMVAQQGNQVRYTDRRGELTQSEECPEHGLGCKDQGEASASLSESAIQNEEASRVPESVNTAVEVVNYMSQNISEYEICESKNNSNVPEIVSKPYDEKKDWCLSEPYRDDATTSPGDKTIPVDGRSTADIKEKNNPKAHLVAGGPTEGCTTLPSLGQMGKPESQLPNNKMKRLCDETTGGTSQQDGLEMESEENSTSGVPFSGPKRRFGKDTFQSTNDDLIKASKEATEKAKVTNNKDDEMAGKPIKRQKQHGKTKSGFHSPSYVMLVVYLLSMLLVVQASDGKWHLSWFCVGKGLNGTNPSIKIGSEFCEFSPPSTSCNVTIENMQYEGFLLSDNCTALLTRDTTKTPYLERVNHKPAPVTYNETFPTREEAKKRLTAEVTLTPNNETSEKRQQTNNTAHWFYRIGIPVLAAAAAVSGGISCGIIYWLVKKRRSPKDTGSPEEAMELNVPPNTDEPQNISNGRFTENGHHHPSPSP